MNYHNIKHDDMLNGDGLRVVLFVSGCSHYCKNCQNPQTWDSNSGIKFDEEALKEIYQELNIDYISNLTLSGGDPLNEHNLKDIYSLVTKIKRDFPNKTIWIYTGYALEEIQNDIIRKSIVNLCDVLVDGPFIEELADVNYPWCGSTNQKVIYIKNN